MKQVDVVPARKVQAAIPVSRQSEIGSHIDESRSLGRDIPAAYVANGAYWHVETGCIIDYGNLHSGSIDSRRKRPAYRFTQHRNIGTVGRDHDRP